MSQPETDRRDSITPTFVTVLYRGEDVPEHSKGIFSPEWADRLYRGVKRNTTRDFRFVCYTDDDYDFKEDIESRPLEMPHRNMYSLLECFREDLGRVVFMGLDTVITGNIDFLCDYEGPFKMLKDPWQPGTCSGVMLFPYMPGMWDGIKEKMAGAHTLHDLPSDMALLQHCAHEVLDGPSNGIYSYKAHIKHSPVLADSAKVIYFHGKEKPHELAGMPWVDRHWGEPLEDPAPYVRTLNNALGNIVTNIRANLKRDLPRFNGGNGRTAVICAGGPSLKQALDEGLPAGDIFALNGVHDYLLSRGIVPRYHVLLDSRPENVAFVRSPDKRVRYLVSAQCDPSIFDALQGHDVTIWHTTMSNGIEGMNPDDVLVAGGATVGLKTLYLSQLMGYRGQDCIGFDSCYVDGEDHAYPQDIKSGDGMLRAVVDGREFHCAPWMWEQAKAFDEMARTLIDNGCSIRIYGDGLIANMMRPATDPETKELR